MPLVVVHPPSPFCTTIITPTFIVIHDVFPPTPTNSIPANKFKNSKQATEQQMSELASQLAMHAAGMNTQHVEASSIPGPVMEAVRQDFASQVGGEGSLNVKQV